MFFIYFLEVFRTATSQNIGEQLLSLPFSGNQALKG